MLLRSCSRSTRVARFLSPVSVLPCTNHFQTSNTVTSPLKNQQLIIKNAHYSTEDKAKKAAAPNPTRASFKAFEVLQTRWNDNDYFGHINNIIYYQFFDDAVNNHLLKNDVGLQYPRFVAQSGCRYIMPVAYPSNVDVGLVVKKLGSSSVVYNIGIFPEHSESLAAIGEYVHVYVDEKGKPKPFDNLVKKVLSSLQQ